MLLQITDHYATDQVVRITLSGELDAASATAFMKEIKNAFQSKPKQLVLFVSGLTFIASAGIRALLMALQGSRGLDVYVIAPQEQVLDTIRRTGIPVIVQDTYDLEN